MASFEQLQMMDDEDESTTSESSGSSRSSSNNSVTTSNDDSEDGVGRISAAATIVATDVVGSPTGQPKKRIRLSLGGSFKAMVSRSSPQPTSNDLPRKTIDDKPKSATGGQTAGGKNNEPPSASSTSTKTTKDSKAIPKSTSSASTKPKKVTLKTGKGISVSPKTTIAKGGTNNNAGPAKDGSAGSKKIVIKTKNNPGSKQNTAKASPSTANASKPGSANEAQKPPQKTQSVSAGTTSGGTTTSLSVTKKRTSIRSVRITPMSSPGLLLPPGTSVRGGNSSNANSTTAATAANNMVSPNLIFAQVMATAGYTTEIRTKNPHRGSSVERVVDDMFDSDVKFCLQFPKLVPDELFLDPSIGQTAVSSSPNTENGCMANRPTEPKLSSSGDTRVKTEQTSTPTSPTTTETPIVAPKSNAAGEPVRENEKLKAMTKLSERLIKAFQTKGQPRASNGKNTKHHGRKIPQYSDMTPLSLALPYPEEYSRKRVEYVAKVNERENAIVAYQKKKEVLDEADPDGDARMETDAIPPIPSPPRGPEPKDLQEIKTYVDDERFGSKDEQLQHHPIYAPKNKELVEHLDQRCFHVMVGRYFGLTSNTFADPYFYGPSAMGIGGLNMSATTGLATASTGGGAGSLGGPLLMTPAPQPSSSSSSSSVNHAKTVPTLSSSSSKTSVSTTIHTEKNAIDTSTKPQISSPRTETTTATLSQSSAPKTETITSKGESSIPISPTAKAIRIT